MDITGLDMIGPVIVVMALVEGYMIKAIRELEGYAEIKLGSNIEQPCSHFSMRIRTKFSFLLRCTHHAGLILENFDTLTSVFALLPFLFYAI